MAIESVGGISAGQQYISSVKTTTVNTASELPKELETAAATENTVVNESRDGGSEAAADRKRSEPKLKDVNDFNKIINQNTIAEFGYNEPTNRITIKIKDKETDEVIKEIPSEKALEMLAKAWELAGLLVDEKR